MLLKNMLLHSFGHGLIIASITFGIYLDQFRCGE
jgi:hypothetical protein